MEIVLLFMEKVYRVNYSVNQDTIKERHLFTY